MSKLISASHCRMWLQWQIAHKTGLFFVLADYGAVYLLQNVKGAFVWPQFHSNMTYVILFIAK